MQWLYRKSGTARAHSSAAAIANRLCGNEIPATVLGSASFPAARALCGRTAASATNQEVEYRAPAAPELARLSVTVTQRDVARTAEALITVTDSLDATLSPAVVNA